MGNEFENAARAMSEGKDGNPMTGQVKDTSSEWERLMKRTSNLLDKSCEAKNRINEICGFIKGKSFDDEKVAKEVVPTPEPDGVLNRVFFDLNSLECNLDDIFDTLKRLSN